MLSRFGDRRRQIAAIDDDASERGDLFAEPGDAERRRSHVDAAAAAAHVERHADQMNRCRHRATIPIRTGEQEIRRKSFQKDLLSSDLLLRRHARSRYQGPAAGPARARDSRARSRRRVAVVSAQRAVRHGARRRRRRRRCRRQRVSGFLRRHRGRRDRTFASRRRPRDHRAGVEVSSHFHRLLSRAAGRAGRSARARSRRSAAARGRFFRTQAPRPSRPRSSWRGITPSGSTSSRFSDRFTAARLDRSR